MELNFKNALVITGGGTGGHYYPAVALAEAAKNRIPEHPIIFVGARKGIEGRQLPDSAWPHLLMDVEGFHGKSPMNAMRSIWLMYAALRYLKRIWNKQRPWAVIGTGGYGSAPALLAAKSLKIPYFIHESNAEPGLVVKLAAKRAERVWLGMEAAKTRLPKAKCRYVGTPVRKSFLRTFKPCSDLSWPFTLLALGGSGGARAINNALFSIGESLLEKHPDWEILHQTGSLEMRRLSDLPRHSRHTVTPFIENMDTVIENASLVLSRAGASTCSELKVAGRPAVLVPLPNSASGHQKQNALAFVKEGRGAIVEQSQDFKAELFNVLSKLMADRQVRESLSKPEPNPSVEECLDDLFQTHFGIKTRYIP
ncbi:MAG: UDP-N-acetylglucosamine--N-acetylmuramyl-(pentapeptide) pyrophosphoryl-undecaprenol N-acetylglucosamine transferase [Holophagales bacterium]|jgi:UDP-N-acetylglucosamine--N-acetylmuramyl-(pentapeptide) pyrophosphoryl-undecaprenol N-acetylglucosamine transferase|nr:UDP-N-acetylglucosamine--N-acetylmuramyl-(pentapeptide) pyrophosphoryl-undecaprenol N-acetylglucosamine transferase [Holophagales bacterium]